MDESATDRTQSWISDTQAMASYSSLLFFVIVLCARSCFELISSG
jgi:hypothetical protein